MAVRKGHFGCLGETSTTPPFQRLVKVSSFPPAYAYAYAYVMDFITAAKTRIQRSNLYYHTGGNLTIFNKDDDTVERKQL